jgi:integrase
MNVEKLRNKQLQLIDYLETNNYSKRYISKFKSIMNKLLNELDVTHLNSYDEIYQAFFSNSPSFDVCRVNKGVLGAIEYFDLYGLFPNGKRRTHIGKIDYHKILSEDFASLIDFYLEYEPEKGKNPTTVHVEHISGITFFLSLQKQGIFELKKITETAVINIFIDSNSNFLKSCSYKKNVKAVFKCCIPRFPDECKKVIFYLPILRERRKNIDYLTSSECEKLKKVLNSDAGMINKRDKAIGLLIFYTGLRCCDIVSLKLQDIDWEKDLIYIYQQKTEVSFTLPLTPTVGNAIYEYIVYDRPKSNITEVFLTLSFPTRRLESGSLYGVSVKLMNISEVRIDSTKRKGFHLFRHHLATALLENNVPRPVISKTLGHSSPNTLNTYLNADFVHLKECSLSIEHFPLDWTVIS